MSKRLFYLKTLGVPTYRLKTVLPEAALFPRLLAYELQQKGEAVAYLVLDAFDEGSPEADLLNRLVVAMGWQGKASLFEKEVLSVWCATELPVLIMGALAKEVLMKLYPVFLQSRRLLATYHPRDMLRDPGLKKTVWRDLKNWLK